MGGEQKRRILAVQSKTQEIAKFFSAYQYALKAATAVLSVEPSSISSSRIIAVGRTDIWPCDDGAVVVIYATKDRHIEVRINNPVAKQTFELIRTSDFATLHDREGKPTHLSLNLTTSDPARSIFAVYDAALTPVYKSGERGYSLRIPADKIIIVGWNADLTKQEPDTRAVLDVRSALAQLNLKTAAAADATLSGRAKELISEFRSLLDDASKPEEALQQFLSTNPGFLYPDAVTVMPKFPLGENFKTDYVFNVQGQDGQQYVFVEIERARKQVFVKDGNFSADFTHAEGQLIDWQSWVETEHAYISRRLPGLFKPRFHLVMGRNAEITEEQKKRLRTKFVGTQRDFSTYDDLLQRFERIVKSLQESVWSVASETDEMKSDEVPNVTPSVPACEAPMAEPAEPDDNRY